MASNKYEYAGFHAGDSVYDSISDYRKCECGSAYDSLYHKIGEWEQFHSMQAAYMVSGPMVYFKSYGFLACVYNRDTNTLYVDAECLSKSPTTNRQLARFLREWTNDYHCLYYIDCGIRAYETNSESYYDGMYTFMCDVMTYGHVVVVYDLAYQFGIKF